MSELAELRGEVERLRKRVAFLESVVKLAVTRGGGTVNGQLELGGWLQFVRISQPDDPRQNCARLCLSLHGGVEALKIIYSDGTTHIIDSK